jgi:hypothetical protein
MFDLENLKVPTVEEIRELRGDDDTVKSLVRLRYDIAAAVRKLEPETLAAVACQCFPDTPVGYAIEQLGERIRFALHGLAAHSEAIRGVRKTESARITPLLGAALDRAGNLQRKIAGQDICLRILESEKDSQREAFRRAGVVAEDINRLLSESETAREARRTKLVTERAELIAEHDALVRFLKSNDESDLPKNFSMAKPPKFIPSDFIQKVA